MTEMDSTFSINYCTFKEKSKHFKPLQKIYFAIRENIKALSYNNWLFFF